MKIKPRNLLVKKFDPDDQLEHQFEEIRDPSRVIRFVASDDTLDRYGEVVLPRGVDFSNFAKNAPLMAFHDYSMWPIGKNVAGEVRGNQLFLDAEFDSAEDDPEAEKVFRKIKSRTVKTGSIGFIPTKFITPGEATKSKADKDLFDQYAGARRIYTNWEIIEFSIVPIPANPNALAAAYQALSNDARKRFGPESLPADMDSDALLSAIDQETEDAIALQKDIGNRLDEILKRIDSHV